MKQTRQLAKTGKEFFWRKHIMSQKKSGESMSAYCREENISYWSFRLWKKKFSALGGDSGKLIEVPISLEINSEKNRSLEIILTSPPRIKLPEQYDPDALQKLLKTLGVSL